MKLSTLALATVLILSGTFQVQAVGLSSFTIDIYQNGLDVDATGSGTFDSLGLSPQGTTSTNPGVWSNFGFIAIGPATSGDLVYTGYTGPTDFGTAGQFSANSETGDSIGLNAILNGLFVPAGYVAGTTQTYSASATWTNTSLATLGLTPGDNYTWTWASGSFGLDVLSAVPEPSQYGLGFVLAFAGLLAWKRFKTVST